MSPFLQTHPSCVQRSFPPRFLQVPAVAALLGVLGCGDISCPEPLSNVDGVCLKLDASGQVELCDGIDNDGDKATDEDWPELGEPCGEGAGIGECVEGQWLCASDRTGVVCEGAVGPVTEVCDGKDNDCDGTPDNGSDELCDGIDNDCDGLADEGLLSMKSELFADHATVTAVDGGFVLTRVVGDGIRVDSYDTNGNATGSVDLVDSPTKHIVFMSSDGDGGRVLVALGQYSFHVLDIRVDSEMAPTVVATQELHEDWRQGIDLSVNSPPVHPRVVASPARFVGYRDIITFALNPLTTAGLAGLTQEPTVAMELPILTEFDAAGPFTVWKQGDTLRAGRLLDNGGVELDIDVALGDTPAIATRDGGPALLYRQGQSLRLSEFSGATLQCRQGGFCSGAIDLGEPEGPTGLAYDEGRDSWFVVSGLQLAMVGRGEAGPVVAQVQALGPLRDAPNRVDVAVSGSTAAVVHAAQGGQSALTFLGCF